MKFYAGLFALAAGLNILLGWHGWPAVFSGSLADPDSYMRLERIQDGIAAGHLVNIVARDDSGVGVLVEWSRLLDIFLWIMAAPFSLIFGWRHALFGAGIALGPIAVGCLGMASAFAVRPLAEDRLLWSAAAAAAVLPGLAGFAAPGLVHYHILMLVFIALAGGGVMRAWRGSIGFAFLAGLAGGFAIWLTPETMPFILMEFAPLLLRWVLTPSATVIVTCAAGFVDVISFALVIDPPQGGYFIAEQDRLSIIYFVLALLFLLGAGILIRVQKLPGVQKLSQVRVRQAAGITLFAALLLLWIGLFPKVVLGPYGLMSAAEMRQFFGVMLELRPLHGGADLLAYLLPGGLALFYSIWRGAAARFTVAGWLWWYFAACVLTSLILADRFLLFVEFPAAAAAAMVPVMLSEASWRARRRPFAAMLARLTVIIIMLIAPELPVFGQSAPSPIPRAGPSCSLHDIGPMLAPYAGQVVLAEAEYTPELLYRSKILTAGSLYQHGVTAYLRATTAWASPAIAVMAPALRATKAKAVLFCPSSQRYRPLAGLPPVTLWDALQNNRPPAWLRLVDQDTRTGWRVYTIADRP